jgi:hypothetical protein
VPSPPSKPNAFEGLPGAFNVRAFEETMLRKLQGLSVTNFARRGYPHALELGFDRQPTIEGQPNQTTYFAWARVVPYSCDHLQDGGILEV